MIIDVDASEKNDNNLASPQKTEFRSYSVIQIQF